MHIKCVKLVNKSTQTHTTHLRTHKRTCANLSTYNMRRINAIIPVRNPGSTAARDRLCCSSKEAYEPSGAFAIGITVASADGSSCRGQRISIADQGVQDTTLVEPPSSTV